MSTTSPPSCRNTRATLLPFPPGCSNTERLRWTLVDWKLSTSRMRSIARFGETTRSIPQIYRKLLLQLLLKEIQDTRVPLLTQPEDGLLADGRIRMFSCNAFQRWDGLVVLA